MRDAGSGEIKSRTIVLIGNPNSGKTTLFNALTGLRQKIGNYPGVTVEKKEGRLTLADGSVATLVDLPGTYSLSASSPDERVAIEILLGRTTHTPPPELVLCIVDATNLERNLYLVSQIIDRQIPVIVALNMVDIAGRHGVNVNAPALSRELGVPVIPTVASKGTGVDELRKALSTPRGPAGISHPWSLPEPLERECKELAGLLRRHHCLAEPVAFEEALDLITQDVQTDPFAPEIRDHVRNDHRKLEFLGIDRHSVVVESRYHWINAVCRRAVTRTDSPRMTMSDRIDRVVTHRVWGPLIFFGIVALIFQAIFSWAEVPTLLLAHGFDWIGREITTRMPPGDLRDLLVNGCLAGVSAVVTFLPQILFLFLFLGLLEDTGYMTRAAFIMDRVMRRVGLPGKSFIPLLSSFACAIPGIMATRTLGHPRDRIATIMIAPLMSCSARLPVYALLIAATIPPVFLFGFLSLPALTLLSMYGLGLAAALGMAWLFKKTLLRGTPPIFLLELPPYKTPSLRSILVQMWERASVFLRKAGTIILGASILLWFLASYPKLEHASPSEQLQHSIAGRAGRAIEPLIRPLGFDWKIGIGLIGSLLQREMFVSTMGTIYNIGASGQKGDATSLRERMQQDTDPSTGQRVFTPLTGICLMAYYVLAMQCLSTVAVTKRETNGWKWPLFQIGYMTALAYAVTFSLYRIGLLLGIGG